MVLALGIWVMLLACVAESAELKDSQTLQRSRLFDRPTVWVGASGPDEGEATLLLDAAKEAAQDTRKFISLIEDFVSAHPSSGWTPSLHAGLGQYYRDQGYYSRALEHWERAWEKTKDETERSAKGVADFALAHWTKLLASLGRVQKLDEVYAATQDRSLDGGPLQQMFNGTREAYWTMKKKPEIAYRCGTYAMDAVAGILKVQGYKNRSLLDIPSPEGGFKLQQLVEFSDQFGIGLVPVHRGQDTSIVVPSIVHWKQNHYAAIIRKEGNRYEVMDPTFGAKTFLTLEAINDEASGYFLVPVMQMPQGWRVVGADESKNVYGKGYSDNVCADCDHQCHPPPPPGCPCEDDGGGPSGGPGGGPGGGCRGCGLMASSGMATWSVSEPHMNLWIKDEPMAYDPPRGPRMSINMIYNQRNNITIDPLTFNFGPMWINQHLGWVTHDGEGNATHYSPGGGKFYSSAGISQANKYTHIRSSYTGPIANPTSWTMTYRDGSSETYAYKVTYSGASTRYYLSSRSDGHNNALQLSYTNDAGNIRLISLTDAIGLSTSFEYNATNTFTDNAVSKITDPFNNVVNLNYNSDGYLTNITDVVGLRSAFVYDNQGWITNLITPYGTTKFQLVGNGSDPSATGRSVLVTHPDGGKEFFLLPIESDVETYIPETYSNYVPTGLQADVADEHPDFTDYFGADAGTHLIRLRNTWHWNAKQFSLLPQTIQDWAWKTNTLLNSTNYWLLAHQKHWTHGNGGGIGMAVAMERDASPIYPNPIVGQVTWYGYQGSSGAFVEGTRIVPDLIARKLPNGEEQWTWKSYNNNDVLTNRIETYGKSDGSIGLRTNVYELAADGRRLQVHYGPRGNVQKGYEYDTDYNIITATNALNEVTQFIWDGNGQLSGTIYPTGLTTTNLYDANGWLTSTIDKSATTSFRTNSFTYLNGYRRTHTDPRGLVQTFTFDALGRLRKTDFPDGTFITNSYRFLDVNFTIDRLGSTNGFGYDSMRRRTSVTNELGRVWNYTYCTCGVLETVTDPLSGMTSFEYDALGRQTKLIYPGGTYETFQYDALHRLTNRTDSAGVSFTNVYSHTGLLLKVNGSGGSLQQNAYDLEDQPIVRIDGNGVVQWSTFDDLGRIVTRRNTNSPAEGFFYSARGLTSQTNQLGLTNVVITYDELGRKLTEKNALQDQIQYSYTPGSDLKTLTDGKSQVTTWSYDVHGRLTNKVDGASQTILKYQYDASGRLTNRWSVAKGNTVYKYDRAGNLTNVVYAASSSLKYWYDANNRLTNMLDGVGTTLFSYTPFGALASEDGPWASDILSFTYKTNRLLASLTVPAPNLPDWVQSYSYDSANRLSNLASDSENYGYQFKGAGSATVPSRLVSKITLPNGLNVTNDYDSLARLTLTHLKDASGNWFNQHEYLYDAANRRTNQLRWTSNSVAYTYDNSGQLKTAAAKEQAGTTRAHEQFGYAYDSAGNLSRRTNNTSIQTFNTANNLNQLSTVTRDTNQAFIVEGTTTSTASSVTVNSSSATLYSDRTWSISASAAGVAKTFTAVATDSAGRQSTDAVTVTLPASSTYTYDSNGNLLADGIRSFVYDDENQLTQVYQTNQWKTEFVYDGKMRCRIRKEFSWSSGWSQTNETRYIYNGNLAIQERDANNIPIRSFVRGLDLSGSTAGAGGIGGLLGMIDHGNQRNFYYHADGNGNITHLSDSKKNVAARYLYDPYGNILSLSGYAADFNRYRFSSKEFHPQSGLTYYLYRFYDPNLQRWISRDPVSEKGGINLYGFVKNRPCGLVDPWGYSDFNRPPDRILIPPGGPPVVHYPYPKPEPIINPSEKGCLEALLEQQQLISQNRGSSNGPGANPDDNYQHCISSCELKKRCGSLIAWSLGQLKETSDLVNGGSAAETAKDLSSNQHGRKCPKPEDCATYCQRTRNQYPNHE